MYIYIIYIYIYMYIYIYKIVNEFSEMISKYKKFSSKRQL